MTTRALDPQLLHERTRRPHAPAPVDLVSVQSQVAYGHVGNGAAAPVLHQLGLDVVEVPTTLLSNPPFYPTTRGRVLPADWLAELLEGLAERAVHRRAGAVLSGYLATAANGDVLADWLARHLPEAPGLRYCLDPVIGDTHVGVYVEPRLEAVFRERLLPMAWLVTPNAFELSRLAGLPTGNEREALTAARALLERGPTWVVAHSVPDADGRLLTLAVSREACWKLASPELAIDVAGTGDVFAALVTAALLRGEPMPRVLEKATAGVHAMLESTLAAGIEELAIHAAVPAFGAGGPPRFPAALTA